jgi:hypothetical protein
MQALSLGEIVERILTKAPPTSGGSDDAMAR